MSLLISVHCSLEKSLYRKVYKIKDTLRTLINVDLGREKGVATFK